MGIVPTLVLRPRKVDSWKQIHSGDVGGAFLGKNECADVGKIWSGSSMLVWIDNE